MIGQVIQLTPEEIAKARIIAKRWFKQQTEAFGGRDRAGVVRRNYERVLLGVLGEMAVAKHLNLPWDGASPFAKTDVGPYQVRTHRLEDSGLHIQQNPDPRDLFILVTTIPSGGRKINQMNIVGWITVREARQRKYYLEPNYRNPEREPCYRVPQKDLHPIEELPPWPEAANDSPLTGSQSMKAG